MPAWWMLADHIVRGVGNLGGAVAVMASQSRMNMRGPPSVEAGAVVGHVVDGDAVLLERSEANQGVGCLGGELPRVPEQVLQHGPHQLPIPFGRQVIRDRELDSALGLGGLQLGRDLPCEVAEVDLLAVQLRARYA